MRLPAVLALKRSLEVPLRAGLSLNVLSMLASLRFETEAPVDDILVETDNGGWIFVQAKTSLNLSRSISHGGVHPRIR